MVLSKNSEGVTKVKSNYFSVVITQMIAMM